MRSAEEEAAQLTSWQEVLRRDNTTAELRVAKWSEDSILLVKEAITSKRRRSVALLMADISETELRKKVEALRDEALPPLKRVLFERETAAQPWKQLP